MKNSRLNKDKPKNKTGKARLKLNSFYVDYANTGWDKINIKQKLPDLMKNASINEKITNYTELGGGYFNKVLMVKTASTKTVVKISPLWNKSGLARENFVYSNLKNNDSKLFKLAELCSYIPDSNIIIPRHAILIIKYINGRKPKTNELASKNFHKKIAAFLDLFHGTPMKGYGWLDEKLVGKNSSWNNFLKNIDNIEIVANSGLLSRNEINWAVNELISNCTDNCRPVLLYGDLKPENILINNGNIHIIDFENCFSGHKYYDIGIGLFFIPQIWSNLKIYLKKNAQKKVKKQIILYAIRHALSCLGHRIAIGNTKESTIAIKRFFELKKMYKKIDD